MSKTIKEWLAEGEDLYNSCMQEYQGLEAQIAELEARLEAKRDEINEIAQVIGRKPMEAPEPRPAVQIIDKSVSAGAGSSRITIARALTGR